MNWQEIDGWFTPSDASLYKYVANKLPDGFSMLEVGAYKGRSTMCMIECLKKEGKKASIDVVDNFSGDQHIGYKDSYPDFKKNVDWDYIRQVYIGNSPFVSHNVNRSYDFIFIDASHDYESVKNDILTWNEHLNPNGLIAGHDYQWSSVRKAVDEIFLNLRVFGTCWLKE